MCNVLHSYQKQNFGIRNLKYRNLGTSNFRTNFCSKNLWFAIFNMWYFALHTENFRDYNFRSRNFGILKLRMSFWWSICLFWISLQTIFFIGYRKFFGVRNLNPEMQRFWIWIGIFLVRIYFNICFVISMQFLALQIIYLICYNKTPFLILIDNISIK